MAGQVSHYRIVIDQDRIEFFIDGVLQGVILSPNTAAAVSLSRWQPLLMRCYNAAATGTAQRMEVADVSVIARDLALNRLWPTAMAGAECGSYNNQRGAAVAQSANYANSAAPVSDDFVWRTLRKEGIQLQRMRSWCVSTDPQFAAKSADIIGLYLNPPERAVVFAVDEKPSIQALSRRRGYVQTSSKKLVQGLQSTYKRHGTVNLFAALEVATGIVKSKTADAKKREDFQSFMDDVVCDISSDTQVHVILDNYVTHKKNDAWLKRHPNVHFHFTPTSASWLNMVEIWFGILTRKALRGASFDSKEDLVRAIREFSEAYHKNPQPFVWKKREVKGSQLRNTVANLCK